MINAEQIKYIYLSVALNTFIVMCSRKHAGEINDQKQTKFLLHV